MNLTKVPVNAKTTTHIYLTCSLRLTACSLRLEAYGLQLSKKHG